MWLTAVDQSNCVCLRGATDLIDLYMAASACAAKKVSTNIVSSCITDNPVPMVPHRIGFGIVHRFIIESMLHGTYNNYRKECILAYWCRSWYILLRVSLRAHDDSSPM